MPGAAADRQLRMSSRIPQPLYNCEVDYCRAELKKRTNRIWENRMGGFRKGGFRKGGFSNNRLVLKPDVAIASEVSILSKNSLAITGFHAKKTQHVQLFDNPLPGTSHSRFPINGTNRFLRKSAVFCENLPFPAVFCEDLRFRNAVIPRKSKNLQKSAKICEELRIWLRLSLQFVPFNSPSYFHFYYYYYTNL